LPARARTTSADRCPWLRLLTAARVAGSAAPTGSVVPSGGAKPLRVVPLAPTRAPLGVAVRLVDGWARRATTRRARHAERSWRLLAKMRSPYGGTCGSARARGPELALVRHQARGQERSAGRQGLEPANSAHLEHGRRQLRPARGDPGAPPAASAETDRASRSLGSKRPRWSSTPAGVRWCPRWAVRRTRRERCSRGAFHPSSRAAASIPKARLSWSMPSFDLGDVGVIRRARKLTTRSRAGDFGGPVGKPGGAGPGASSVPFQRAVRGH